MEVEVDEQGLSADLLRRAVARAADLSEERLKLVKGGAPVADDTAARQLRDGGEGTMGGRAKAGASLPPAPLST